MEVDETKYQDLGEFTLSCASQTINPVKPASTRINCKVLFSLLSLVASCRH